MLKFINYKGTESRLKCEDNTLFFDALTQTKIYTTLRGTQYEVDRYGAVRRRHPCSGKLTKVGFIE